MSAGTSVRSPSALVEGLRSRVHVVVRELAKFGIVGAVCLVVDLGLYNVFSLGVGLGPLTSKGLSTVAAATLSYFLNRHWSFRHRARTGIRREYVLFFLLNGVGLGISWICLGTTYYVLDLRGALAQNVANLVGIGIGTVFRFLAYKRWVFLSAEPAEARAMALHPAAPR